MPAALTRCRSAAVTPGVLMIESLEARRLLAASAVLADGVLTVTGTDGDDVIEVYQYGFFPGTINDSTGEDGEPIEFVFDRVPVVRVVVNGQVIGDDSGRFGGDRFNYGDVARVRVDGLAGDDVISLAPSPARAAELDTPGEIYTLMGGLVLPSTVEGAAGDDTIYGGGGDDVLIGGRGDDFVVGGKGDDLVSGGAGRDRLYGTNGQDTLDGGSGRDGLNPGKGFDVVFGGGGTDTVDYSDQAGDHLIALGRVDPAPAGGPVPPYVLVDDGATPLVGRPVFTFPPVGPDPAVADRLSADIENALGSPGDDVIFGNDADNVLLGNGGDDAIWGGFGNDDLYGGAGDDTIYAYDRTDDSLRIIDDLANPPREFDLVDGGDGDDDAVIDGRDRRALANIEAVEQLPYLTS